MGFVAGFAGALAEGMMKSVCGRLTNFVNIGVKATDAIAIGLVDVMKNQISGAGSISKFEITMPKSQGFSDPTSFKDKGEAMITAEKANFTRYIQWLGNNKQSLEGNISPADIFKQNITHLASLQAGGFEARGKTDTKALERELWKSWIKKNGKKNEFCFKRLWNEFCPI